MVRAEPGRNDPCPCGSGRKYKQCCGARRDAERRAGHGLRAACGRLTNQMLRFAAGAWSGELLLHAWDDFWNWDADVPDDITCVPEGDVMFLHCARGSTCAIQRRREVSSRPI